MEKPLQSAELLNAIQEAVSLDRHERLKEAWKRQVREMIAMLTHKERRLVHLIAVANSTKAIAEDLALPPVPWSCGVAA